MPPKKRGKKGKKGKKAPEPYISSYRMPVSLEGARSLFSSAERTCTINFKLITWSFLDFSVELPVSATLRVMQEVISQHHSGAVGNLTLWKAAVHPKNILKDYSKTLEDIFKFSESLSSYNYDGEEVQENSPLECTLFYDFKPLAPDCPLLLSSPRVHNSEENTEDLPKLRRKTSNMTASSTLHMPSTPGVSAGGGGGPSTPFSTSSVAPGSPGGL